jgi:proline dehydrogenase
MIGRALILKTSAWRPVERMVRKSFLFRGVVRRFIAGDTLEEALTVCEGLAAKGFLLSLDYLGENTKSEDEAIAARNTYIEMLHKIAKSPCGKVTNISIKLTQCGLDQGEEFAEKNYLNVLEAAQELDNFVRVDMEGSAYTQRTVDIIENALHHYKNTGTVLQTYLYRTPDDVQTMIRLQARTRLVKGAYLEPEEVAFKDKEKVDEAYIECAKKLMQYGFYPALATHDEKIINTLKAFAQEENIEKSRYEFQMLYGIRRDLQESLLKEGYNVRVYVPFGLSWYPYFTRRLAERPANIWFVVKSLVKG